MSDLIKMPLTDVAATTTSEPPSLMSRVFALAHRRATWVLIDQGVVSLGNFLTINLLVRNLAETKYGAFNVLLETMLYLNSLQAAVINYPLTIRGASGDHANLKRLATASVGLTLGLLPLLGASIAVAAAVLQGWEFAIVAIAAMVLWQVQETLRRALISELRFADAVWGDAISFLGQAATLFILGRMGLITFGSALLVMSLTSGAAIALQAMQIGLVRIRLRELKVIVRDFWKLGWWMLLTNSTGLITALSYTWTLKWAHGLVASAVWGAIVAMFKLANPIQSSMCGLIVPAVARARANDGNRAASRVAIRYIAFGATLLMPYFLVIALFPTQLLKFFYGADSPYVNEGQWLRLFVANYTAVYLLSTINAWLAALGHSRWNFYSQVVNIVITISMSLPLIYWLGVPGVIIGGLLSVIGTGAVTGYFIRRAAYTAPDDPETTSQTVVIPPEA